MGTIIFDLKDNPDNNQNFEMLKSALEGTGIDVRFFSNCFDGTEAHSLIFNFDTDILAQKRSRGAGRKKATVKDHNSIVTLCQIEEMKKTMTIDEICIRLKISRSTYFRRLKIAQENREKWSEDDVPF